MFRAMRFLGLLLTATVFLGSAELSAFQKDERTFKVTGIPSVMVKNISGDIEVRSGKTGTVQVTALRDSEDVEMEVEQLGDKIRIETRHRHRKYGRFGSRGSINYIVVMPSEGNLEAHNVSGNISASNITGELLIDSVSGDLQLQSLGKRLAAKSVSGNISLSKGQVDAELNTVSGDVTVSDLEGRIGAASVSGSLRVVRVRAPRLTLGSTSGDIVVDAPLLKNGSYNLTSHSGSIMLTVSKDASFELTARTFSGELESDLPLKLFGPQGQRRGGKSVRASYGTGEATLELSTFSGDVRIIRK
jgi:DUF4097 and DUF4098 domain-containing protein YvlB